jgi:hypothetical protein
MAQEYSSDDLMAAIVDLRDATGAGLSALRGGMDRRFEALEYRLNRRFDSVDERFDAVDRRLDILEQRI